MRSDWNVERGERARAARRAQKFAWARNSQVSSLGGGWYYPLICHVLPLGRLSASTGEDRLAFCVQDHRELIPPRFPDLYTRFQADGLEFVDDPRATRTDRGFSLAWFRSGGAEVRVHPYRARIGLVEVIDEIIPFLGRTATTRLETGPPSLVSVSISGRLDELCLKAPRLAESSRMLPAERSLCHTLPPLVIEDAAEFDAGWPRHAERLLNQFAQVFGHPAFDRKAWHPDF